MRKPTSGVNRRVRVSAAFGIMSFLSTAVHAECYLPPAPSKVPEAATATRDDMVASMQTLKRYSTDVSNYLKCLAFEAQQNRLSPDQQTRRHNEAIENLEEIATKFNEQVRLFKERNGGE